MRIHFGVVLVACLAMGLSTGSNATSFVAYDTGDSSELLTTSPGDDVHRVLYSINVGTVALNDVLVVVGEAQLTNNTAGGVRLSSQLILGASASATTGTELDENNASDISTDIQRGVPVKLATKNFVSGSSSTYVNFVVWSNGTLNVDQDYGRLQVLKISP